MNANRKPIDSPPQNHLAEVRAGKRFRFGKNWQHFSRSIDAQRIESAEDSLRSYLGDLTGKTFLDIGSGSGLFSLAARRLGARVTSFDYDPDSVAATRKCRDNYCPHDADWNVVGEGSVLDSAFLATLSTFDIVYSWGVLHHTGAMWAAFANVVSLVKPGGLLYISIYNQQHYFSAFNRRMKKVYVGSNVAGRAVIGGSFVAFQAVKGLVKDLALLRDPLQRYRTIKQRRGMSMFHDWIDWVGGYPFEVAKPEEVFDYFRGRGFRLLKLKTCGGGHGCNEFVFERERSG
jgi:2-polyprenyl-6-hydroxyphenyl methylase/3-demethylubiquinone-9 3-methyltransferase